MVNWRDSKTRALAIRGYPFGRVVSDDGGKDDDTFLSSQSISLPRRLPEPAFCHGFNESLVALGIRLRILNIRQLHKPAVKLRSDPDKRPSCWHRIEEMSIPRQLVVDRIGTCLFPVFVGMAPWMKGDRGHCFAVVIRAFAYTHHITVIRQGVE